MKQGLKAHGFTIIEVMIFLAVSSALLIASLRLIGGQQAKTQFIQSIHSAQQQIDDVINNVSTGYYASSNNFECSAPLGVITITTGTSQSRGTNGGCTYIGRALQYGVSGTNKNEVDIYDIVGLQYVGNTTNPPTTLSEAMPVVIAPTDASFPQYETNPPNFLKQNMDYGLQMVAMHYTALSTKSITRSLAIITSFSSFSSSGSLVSGSRVASLYAINNVSSDISSSAMADSLDNANNYTLADNVTICLNGGTGQYGVITVGSNGRQLNTKLDIYGNLASVPSGECVDS